MMAEKARFFGDEGSRALILQAASPKEMKALGRGIRGFDEARWRGVRERVVLKGSLLKFGQNPALLSFLLSTAGVLVEASPYDNIWGIGETLCTRAPCRVRVTPPRWQGCWRATPWLRSLTPGRETTCWASS